MATDDDVATTAKRIMELLENVSDSRVRVKSLEFIKTLVFARLKELTDAAAENGGAHFGGRAGYVEDDPSLLEPARDRGSPRPRVRGSRRRRRVRAEGDAVRHRASRARGRLRRRRVSGRSRQRVGESHRVAVASRDVGDARRGRGQRRGRRHRGEARAVPRVRRARQAGEVARRERRPRDDRSGGRARAENPGERRERSARDGGAERRALGRFLRGDAQGTGSWRRRERARRGRRAARATARRRDRNPRVRPANGRGSPTGSFGLLEPSGSGGDGDATYRSGDTYTERASMFETTTTPGRRRTPRGDVSERSIGSDRYVPSHLDGSSRKGGGASTRRDAETEDYAAKRWDEYVKAKAPPTARFMRAKPDADLTGRARESEARERHRARPIGDESERRPGTVGRARRE